MAAREQWGDWCIRGGCGGRRFATVRRCISSKIDARRPAASSARSDATAKEGHVNYDVFDILVEACSAPTTRSLLGIGANYDLSDVARCSHDRKWMSRFGIRAHAPMQKIVYFLVRVREGGSAKHTTPTRS